MGKLHKSRFLRPHQLRGPREEADRACLYPICRQDKLRCDVRLGGASLRGSPAGGARPEAKAARAVKGRRDRQGDPGRRALSHD